MILLQGSEFERKGGDLVVEAFRRVRGAIPEAQLIIIGTNIEIVAEGVSVLGWVPPDEVPALLLRADVVAAPARCDPLTAFVIEAMSYGTPCVASACSGIAGSLAGGGVVIVRPDADLLADTLIDLLSHPDLLEELSRKARMVVRDELNWGVVSQRIAGVAMCPATELGSGLDAATAVASPSFN